MHALLCDLCAYVSLCVGEREPVRACIRVHVCVLVLVCVNGKLTAAVKFLSEHHRGEADGS